ncbi:MULTISPECIES: ribosomal protein S18-alanine N-acetyltransferase [unclassified Actinomyces]|uniref:ribosomal protein S18-alanine N-acetyltransferase n=2 Tax=Actinomyces TaxID=1654 RepID=UPI002016E702|nr:MULTISPECIES: ribosomal protein S18-alanine N-acetyltransferase [unclassified Actinomyces]MCL3778666.1 ribosomal protein S18-alanine N-acetyltransferase [Actinomyces sp. AC-20-1]MCL3790129.1 ribosomal protein S18-alanine N-acetyltransferase [Actinomyces sp. 187325]MCL3791225.1 ribosomal protein S18-alanine N-acetyltransferase [Actinomyces sp. 186855]MCL3794492.1 ribosomal protein S18-alanine N-acetyltransferase [Actinomyces sp. 217892]
MTEADLPLVAALETELFGAEAWSAALLADELAAAGGPGADRAYAVVEQAPAAGQAAADRAALLGYAGLWYGDGRGDADLLTIATAPAARRRGVATLLLDHLLAEARRRGCEHVLLEVRASNTGAQALYARHGFEALGTRRRYYTAPDEDALVMRLRLGPGRGPGPVGAEAVAGR